MLTYSLANLAVTEPLSAASVCYDSRVLSAVLRYWRNAIIPDDPTYHELIYMLEHQYTDASLKFNTLKGADLLKARFLRDVCGQMDFIFYLASLERMVMGSPEESYDDRRYGYRGYGRDYYDGNYRGGNFHAIVEEIDVTLKLTRVVDLAGNEIGKECSIHRSTVYAANLMQFVDLISGGKIIWEMGSRKVTIWPFKY